ncbi:hypothetical protein EXU57_16740 [Segetibacter sp. 3557_3]|uniref:sensor histidine kinase n=1 Tax=Segetibacter sp. 3557_3 TaxID=2547429 RepID=UPI001058685D|nr:histidine kinase [Segetibacter sp. 3557_3]TDH23455.1 hypothetical protein EXU57_16740 [Segetibacter sp. 3557_3]
MQQPTSISKTVQLNQQQRQSSRSSTYNSLAARSCVAPNLWLVFALFTCLNLSGYAQRTDTVLRAFDADTTSWRYKMENGGERWQRGRAAKDFQLFVKWHYPASDSLIRLRANVSYYGTGTLYWLNGAAEVEIAAAGITPQNKDSFLYHITVNDSIEVQSWASPTEFRTTNGLTYAYLGKFRAKQKLIRLELYRKNRYYDRSVSIFNDLYMPAPRLQSIVVNHTNQYLFRPHQQHYIPNNKQFHFSREQWEKGRIKFDWSDSINHLAVSMDPTVQNDLYNVYLKRTIGKKIDTAYISNAWELSYYGSSPFLRINSSFFNKAGQYEIMVVPEVPGDFRKNNMARAIVVPFTVQAANNTLFSLREMLSALGVLFLSGVVLVTYLQRRNKNRLALAARQREMARLQLTSVRARLNPHFLFNALAGIQNLINKNDMGAANLYLSRFARITRSALNENKTDLISISEEVKLLDDYLQMEQLRFNFSYHIETSGDIDDVNTEIPAMLIQPFVENAVKHGVAPLGEKGLIKVLLKRENNNLVVTVQDNGSGFDEALQPGGMGLELSRKRIELLNNFHQEPPLVLKINSGTNGTTVLITLQNWL